MTTATVGYVSVSETVNTYFEITVTSLPVGTAPGSVFFTASIELADYGDVTYQLPVELQITCPSIYSSLVLSATPSFASPFSYDLATLPSQVETVSTVTILPDLCGFTVLAAEIIDITDPLNPVVETMITYAEASAQITILVPTGNAPSLHLVTKQYSSRLTI